jgi:orotate phosphoribosyltransferase
VTLASGREADYYVDLRRVTLHHRARPWGAGDADLVAGWDAVAAGGLTMGADPVAGAMRTPPLCTACPSDAFVVRKQGKTHGLQRRVEGPDVVGRRVVAVEDTSTTGGSVLTAVEALREVGAEVVGVAVIVDRDTGPTGGGGTRAGVPYAFGLADLGLD